jgi:serine/threonine-protein phosphatase 2A regulatory subunit B''
MSYSFSLSLALNDLFFDWLSRAETKSAIENLVKYPNTGESTGGGNPIISTPVSATRLSSPPHSFPSSSPPRSPQRRLPLSPSASLRSPSVLSPSASISPARSEYASIRQFYFPDGIPVSPATKQRELSLINEIFREKKQSQTSLVPSAPLVLSLSLEDFYPLTTLVCGFSSFFTSSLFSRVLALENDQGMKNQQKVRLSLFERYFVSEVQNYEPNQRLHRLLRKEGRKYLLREDFSLFVNELVHRHPGLEFLDHTPEFQVKYAQTVIGRIFYQINKSGSERLTLRELKSSNFLLLCALLDTEEDINKLNDYFSYEHFYVIYVKFWELDQDHNGLIDGNDLLQYEEYSLTPLIVEKIIAGCGRKKFCDITGNMNYLDFVTFLISEVDKSSEQALDYWFNCVDLDGDGLIAPFELESFFKEQQGKIQALSQEQISFPDICCQLLDSIRPNDWISDSPSFDFRSSPAIRKSDLRTSKLAPQFFNTLFNLTKFIQGEQRDPMRLKQLQETPQLSDWDRFAIGAYYRLAEQEQLENDGQDHF